jgi:hypothetical protein
MPKGWADLPPSLRWLAGGIAVILIVLAITWVLFVPAADWLALHDVGSVNGTLHETALDNARGRLITLGAGLFAAGALLFTARNFALSREGQVTDRYTKAIEQLGSKEIDVRIGGIYALERIARDSAKDHPTVMEVLTAFIPLHSHDEWSLPAGQDGTRLPRHDSLVPGRAPRPDIQLALTVVARRDSKRDIRTIDLTGADLTGADLPDADLIGAALSYVDFTDANLSDAALTGAYLYRAKFNGAYLGRTDLAETVLIRADFSGAQLGADLRDADLTEADLTGAQFFAQAEFGNQTKSPVKLTGANLNLTGTKWPENQEAPEGWELDAASGRLGRTGTDSRSAEAN